MVWTLEKCVIPWKKTFHKNPPQTRDTASSGLQASLFLLLLLRTSLRRRASDFGQGMSRAGHVHGAVLGEALDHRAGAGPTRGAVGSVLDGLAWENGKTTAHG